MPVTIPWVMQITWLTQLCEPRSHAAQNRDTQLLEGRHSIKKSCPTGQMIWFDLDQKMKNASMRSESLQEKSTLPGYLLFFPIQTLSCCCLLSLWVKKPVLSVDVLVAVKAKCDSCAWRRRRNWQSGLPSLGKSKAQKLEACFGSWPQLVWTGLVPFAWLKIRC